MPKATIVLACLLLIGCKGEFPKDPEGTLDRIHQSGIVRVGVVHNPPWTDIRTTPPTGSEIEIIHAFAGSLGARAQWNVLSLHEGIEKLKKGEADILIGGLVKSTPYKGAGYTRTYITTQKGEEEQKHVMGVPRGENRLLVALEKFLKHHPLPEAERK